MIVGNDVVDLGDRESRPESLHRRWDLRAFTPAERDRVHGSPSPHRTRWALWAAKESAFKVARKLDPGVSFVPRAFRVGEEVAHGLHGARVVVRNASRAFDVWLEETRDWVHAVAVAVPRGRPGPSGPPGAAVETVTGGSGAGEACPGRRVREVARSLLASGLALLPGEITIRSMDRIPRALCPRRGVEVDLSLSHHGRFVACAVGGVRRR